MPTFIRVAVALELLSMAVECGCPATRALLPIGGSHIVQFGIFMAIAVAATELFTRNSN